MNGYQPLDLSSFCNASPADVAGRHTAEAGDPLLLGGGSLLDAPVGEQSFRGLPFLVGGPQASHDDLCFIELAGGSGPVGILVGRKAPRIIFAHRAPISTTRACSLLLPTKVQSLRSHVRSALLFSAS